jgi:hypothetical protein
MKIKRQNRIINTNMNSVGLIFLASNCSINPKKKLNLNKTKLYHTDNNYITLVKLNDWEKHLAAIIDKTHIEEIIDIYRNRLFIIHIKYDYSLKGYSSQRYLDLFNSMSDSIYNDIYFYNKNCKEFYLNTIIKDSDNVFHLTVKDIYYYLIGYI